MGRDDLGLIQGRDKGLLYGKWAHILEEAGREWGMKRDMPQQESI